MHTTRELVRTARRLFNIDWVPARIQRHNRHAWIRSVQMLGPRWLIHSPMIIVKEDRDASANH